MTDIVGNSQQDVIQLKKDVPQANLLLPRSYSPTLSPSVWFGYDGDSPFKDERVRQALSMLVDRDAYNGVIYNTAAFEAEGLPVQPKYNTCITGRPGPYWLDAVAGPTSVKMRSTSLTTEKAEVD